MSSGDVPQMRVVAGGVPSGGGGGGGEARSRAGVASGRGRLRAVGEPPGAGRGPFDWRAELELVAPDVTLPPGCSRGQIAAAEGSLGLTFPRAQVELLNATDGVYDGECHHWYVWSLERLVDENFEQERPSDLLLVGDDAGSGWFCLPLEGAGAIHLDRATGRRRTLARDLRGLWLGWFGGTVRV
jgi:hypothetical protein